MIALRSTRSSTRLIHDHFQSASRSISYSTATRYFLTCQKISGRKPNQCRPTRPPPTTHADRTRPVPDRLVGLDRVDLIASGNPALRQHVYAETAYKRNAF
ncbi:hypothetical protein DPMN_107132 [Dreissena polymorpha]|uniref:Uncharacterized protein n=1 Tax=Dreissena polymorpha TaxID=45954 RepID=A0A9D4K6J3_DREPO|nr:hypothetical protein DPMN_107132 [Dreissena polymorpha]